MRNSNQKINETSITRLIKQVLFQCGAFPIKIAGGPYQKPGISDLLICYEGKFVAVEVKKPGGKLSPLQEQFLHDVRTAGGIAFVAYSVDDVVRELKLQVKLYPIFATKPPNQAQAKR